MSAVESRLAATLAKHPLYADEERDVCACGWEPDYEAVDFTAGAAVPAHEHVTMQHAAHIAAVIASADDLAVIELPKPINSQEGTDDENGWRVWHSPITEGPLLFDDGEIHYQGGAFKADGVKGHAAALLAAAKAAEGVSDRG